MTWKRTEYLSHYALARPNAERRFMCEVEGKELEGSEVLPLDKAAEYLEVSQQYLTNLKKKGYGPLCYIKRVHEGSSACVLLYKKKDLDAWKDYIKSHPKFKFRQNLRLVEGGGSGKPINPWGWDGHYESD